MLYRWALREKGKDPRHPGSRSPGALLLDFYRANADRLAALDRKDEAMDQNDLQEHMALEKLFEDDSETPATILARIESELDDWTTSGDATVDEWNEMLDRGEIPKEFWGPAGPPSEEDRKEWPTRG